MNEEVIFQALTDGTRRAILNRLQTGPASVNDLVELFDFTQSAVSQHLRILRDAGIVKVERSGRQLIYRLHGKGLKPAYDWLSHYERFWSEKLANLGEYLRRPKQ